MEAFEKKVRDSFFRQLFMTTIGAEMISVDRDVEIRFPFSSNLTQQNGFVHAGAVTSVMDSACGYAAMSVAPEEAHVLSVEFKLNLLAPAAGESFVARAAVKHTGRRLTVCTADAFAVTGGEETLIATMLATMMNMESKPIDVGAGDQNQSHKWWLNLLSYFLPVGKQAEGGHARTTGTQRCPNGGY